MKTIKILIPAAMTFALFMGMNTINAQSTANESLSNPLVKIASDLIPKKAIGLDYSRSLVAINEALTEGVKADHTIDFQGKVMINIALDSKGKVASISFDKNISTNLETSIEAALKSATITPVLLNGRAKAQTFKIPLIIK